MDNRPPKTMKLAKELVGLYYKSIESRMGGERRHLDSGFPVIDKQFPAWLHEDHLIVLAGRPGMGKSALAQQIAENVAMDDRSSVIASLEMSSHEIIERSISRRADVSVTKLKLATIKEEELDRITEAAKAISSLPLLVDDASFFIDELVKKLTRMADAILEEGLPKLGLVVVDYIQLVSAKAQNRTLEVGQVTRGLKRLAMQLHVPVIALSQLNRGVEGRDDKRPRLSDLRDSGEVEQDADFVAFLYREGIYQKTADHRTAEFIVGKNRHGVVGSVDLTFVGERIMFSGAVS